VHLSCWCGHRPLVLTHKWPDSRWLNHSWREAVILQQNEMFNWEEPIKQMLEKIKNNF